MSNYENKEYVNPCLLGTPKEGIRATMPIGINCPLKVQTLLSEWSSKAQRRFKKNLNSLVRMGTAGISKLYWDGAEPMTNPDIETYLFLINKLKQKEEMPKHSFKLVSIATNGTYVVKDRSKTLYELGLKNILVSLDGATDTTHDTFRSKGSYEKATKAIQILSEIGYDVRIGTTLWRGMLNESELLIKKAIDLNVKEVAFNWLQPLGDAIKHPEILVPNEYYSSVMDNILELKERYSSLIKINIHRAGELDQNKKCPAARNVVYISGEWVWPCSWISVISPEFKSQMSLMDNSLEDILNKDPILDSFRNMTDKISLEGGVCPAACKIYGNSYTAKDPISKFGIHRINQKKLPMEGGN